MALARAIDAIGPVQAGIEPLRRIRRDHLAGEHEAMLVEEGLCVFLGLEITALPAPIGPATGKTIKHLPCAHLGTVALVGGEFRKCRIVGNRTPEP